MKKIKVRSQDYFFDEGGGVEEVENIQSETMEETKGHSRAEEFALLEGGGTPGSYKIQEKAMHDNF